MKRLIKGKKEAESSLDLEPNVAGLLCYALGWITGVIFLLLEQKNKFVRFHATQSIITFGIIWLGGSILGKIAFVGPFFGTIIGIFAFILWIVLMVKAYHYELYKLPVAGEWAQRLSGVSKVEVRVRRRAEAPKPPPPPVDEFRAKRGERLAASSFAIAWGVALFIFFNFFYRYLAFYSLEKMGGVSHWVRYEVLTPDYHVWLPILSAGLTLLIIGHIILLIFDRYWLREVVEVVLNLVGVGVIASLLYIYPFDFSRIPSDTLAGILPVVVGGILIAIAVGLGIAALVRLIRLIVNLALGRAGY